MIQQMILELPHLPALGREDFLVAGCNARAAAWIDRWPEWPGNALAIYGPPGCGKSHLAEVWRSKSGGRLIGPAELTLDAVPDIAGAGAVALDRADEVQEAKALLHLLNLLRQDGGYLLSLSSVAPARWKTPLADLRSRLAAMQAVGIENPDDHLLGAVMLKMLSDRQLRAPQEVIAYLLTRMDRSFAAASDLVVCLDSLTAGGRNPLTIPMARAALEHLAQSGEAGA